MHSTREDPAIPLNVPEDAIREQESGEPALSLPLLAGPFSLLWSVSPSTPGRR